MKLKKRVLCLILTVAVLISSISVVGLNILADDASPYWTGNETAPTKGGGTSSNPYIISTAEEFADIMQNVRGQNVYYKLSADIYLNDITKINWSTGEVESGYNVKTWTPTAFRGYIDGDGHTIYGLYINKKPSSYEEGNSNGKGVGLLTENWYNNTVEFKNLGMDYVYLNGASAVSPFVARQNKGTINFDSCYVGENVTLKGYSTAAFVAQGGTSTINIKNSYSLIPTENMVAKSKYGSILGDVWTPSTKSISDTFCIGKLYGNNKPTGSKGDLASCYATAASKSDDGVTILDKSEMQGAAASINMPALDFKNVFITSDKYPVLRVFQCYEVICHITNADTYTYGVLADTTFADLEKPKYPGYMFQGFYLDENLTVKAENTDLVYKYSDIYTKWRLAPYDALIWNGAENEPVNDADQDGYIDIVYPSELAWVVANDGDNGGKYELLNDIYLNDITVDADNGSYVNNSDNDPIEWYVKSDCAFNGEINGNGHVVYGLFYNDGTTSQSAAGLIPSVDKATIKNIGVENSYIVYNSEFRTGAIVGTVHSADVVSINGCYVGKNVYLKAKHKIGGITGGGAPKNKSNTVRVTISNCYSLATIDADKSGGIVGNLWSTYNRYLITGCYTNGRFSEGTSDLGNSSGNYSLQTDGGTRWTTLALDDMIGANAKNKMSNLDFDNVYMTTFDYPQLRSFYDYVLDYQINSSEKVNIGVSENTTFADLVKPARLGYTFDGFYTDAEFTVKADDNALVKDYAIVYAKLDQITSGDTVYNNYDQEGAVFTKITQEDKRDYQVEGNFNATTSNFTATTEKGLFSQYDAWVEPGVGVNGSNALKVIRARGYEWQWQTAVMLYDFDGSAFVPETNSYYRISLKYKLSSLASGKELKLRIREKSNGKVNATYENVVEYGILNQKRIDSVSVSNAWVKTEFKFATGEDVEALYLAITTENTKWWAEELEFYIDDIIIEKITKEEMDKAYSSPDSINTYDEDDITFTKIEQTDKRDYQVEGNFLATKSSTGVGTENGRLTQYDAFVENGVGIDGGNAVKVIRAQGYEKQWPTAIMIYDANYNAFTPKANSYYQITLKYKLDNIKSGKQIMLRLRQTVDGKVNVKYDKVFEYGTINKKRIEKATMSDNWVEATMKFATGDEVESLYLAITTENTKWWAEELEFYIDNIEIKEITKAEMNEAYVSPDSKNTYDEKNITFEKIEQTDKRDYQVAGKFLATKSSMGVGTEKGCLTQYDAFVEKGSGVGGGNAVKVLRAQGYQKQWPTAVMLYDKNQMLFTPRANSFYQITLKYKVSSLRKGKQIELRLRQTVGGKVNVKYDKVVDYGRINEDIINYLDVSNEWVETTFKFRTGDEVAPIFLAITTENTRWWAEDLEFYIDDIAIKEITYDDMGFDEGVKGRVWSGKIAMEFSGGSGTQKDPYLIETPEQLAKCVNDSALELTYYKIIADLKLNDTSTANWTKNAKSWLIDKEGNMIFRGHLDGGGHIISGLYYNATDGSVQWAALFPHLARNAYIEKLGIVNSSIIALNGTEETYAAAFGAFVNSSNSFEGTTEPKLSQCFADDTVYIEACYAGGLLCGIAGKAPVTLENCYFTGTLTGVSYTGTFLGNSWTNDNNFSTIKNCYASTPDRDHIVSNKGIKSTNYENVYSDSTVDSPRPSGVEYSILKFMQGNSAKELMVGFDFNNIWKTVEGGTPVLRAFASDSYSSTRESEDVTISFITNGGSKCDPISGQARSKMPELPKPTRYGYEFVGWYHFYDLNLKCEHTVFPDFNAVLYAKWIATGFEIDFEGSYDPQYDFNSAVVHHKPGANGYLPAFNRNGMKSMHCSANEEVAPIFLLSYENGLEAGKEYDITIRVKSDSAKAISGNVELLFSKHPDISAELKETGEAIEFKDVNSTGWKEFKATFVAGDEYIFFRTPKNMSLYFDDVQVVPTGKSGDIQTIGNGNAILQTIIIVCASIVGVVALGGIAALVIFIIKKRRKAM